MIWLFDVEEVQKKPESQPMPLASGTIIKNPVSTFWQLNTRGPVCRLEHFTLELKCITYLLIHCPPKDTALWPDGHFDPFTKMLRERGGGVLDGPSLKPQKASTKIMVVFHLIGPHLTALQNNGMKQLVKAHWKVMCHIKSCTLTTTHNVGKLVS